MIVHNINLKNNNTTIISQFALNTYLENKDDVISLHGFQLVFEHMFNVFNDRLCCLVVSKPLK
jgi:hypothetical protein